MPSRLSLNLQELHSTVSMDPRDAIITITVTLTLLSDFDNGAEKTITIQLPSIQGVFLFLI